MFACLPFWGLSPGNSELPLIPLRDDELLGLRRQLLPNAQLV